MKTYQTWTAAALIVLMSASASVMAAYVMCGSPVPAPDKAGFHPFDGPKPILVFMQSDPWLMVVGSDTPRVAVYENGEVIFAKKVNKRLVYHQVVLQKDGLAELQERFKPVFSLKALLPAYNIRPNVTDQPEAKFYFRREDSQVTTRVYGLMAAETELPAYTTFPDGPQPTVPPKELLDLHKWLCAIDFPNSVEWTPKYVEVMFWDYSYAPAPSIYWPKDWPTLDSDRVIKHGDIYSLFLDGSLLPRLREFLVGQKEKGAVELGGKKWAVAYRSAFPSEPLWRKAFAEAGKRPARKDG